MQNLFALKSIKQTEGMSFPGKLYLAVDHSECGEFSFTGQMKMISLKVCSFTVIWLFFSYKENDCFGRRPLQPELHGLI